MCSLARFCFIQLMPVADEAHPRRSVVLQSVGREPGRDGSALPGLWGEGMIWNHTAVLTVRAPDALGSPHRSLAGVWGVG